MADSSLVVTDAAMTEVGDGWYKYDFSAYDPTLSYVMRCDGGVAQPTGERYTFSGSDNTEATWAAVMDGSYTAKNLMRVVAAVLAGKVSGAEAHHPVFRSITDAANVVDATTDSNGNRLGITVDTNY